MAETPKPDAALAAHLAAAVNPALDADARTEAIDAIVESAESAPLPEEAFDALIGLLADEDVRETALRALTYCPSPRAIEPLIAAIDRERADNPRWFYGMEVHHLCEALGACGAGDARALRTLTSLLHVEQSMYAAKGAYEALFAMGPKAVGAKAALEERVSNGPPWERAHAHWALWAQDGDTERHVTALVPILAETKEGGGSAAAAAKIALESIGEPALAVLEREKAFGAALAKKATAVAESIRARMQRKAQRALAQAK
ncbi:MAG: HEAT repeat domain-containing protein [Myxococcales bacterium]|nr:HEAT repeat domain-containing protein [Myxococcales bacterium]